MAILPENLGGVKEIDVIRNMKNSVFYKNAALAMHSQKFSSVSERRLG
jgi:hypothetical protein